MTQLQEMGQRAKKAVRILNTISTAKKNEALNAIAEHLIRCQTEILEANTEDMETAKASGMSASLLDRLSLTSKRLNAIAQSVQEVSALPDPIGKIIGGGTNPNGLRIEKISVPLGVVGMIFEARPNVTVDAAVLCLKSSNASILRGGKEAIRTSSALEQAMRRALESVQLPADCIQLVKDTSRNSALEMMKLIGYLYLLIRSGGAGFIS